MSDELATAVDAAGVAANSSAHQPLAWRAHAHVEKWDDEATRWVRNKTGLTTPKRADFRRLKVTPYEVVDQPGNLLTTAGLQRITSLIIGTGSTQAFTQTATRIGTGDGSTTAVIGDTDLSAATGNTHRWFQTLDQAPTAVNGVLTFHATFASGDGNYAWNEWGIDATNTGTASSSATVSNVLLNHKSSAALGTKTVGSSWALTTTITLS